MIADGYWKMVDRNPGTSAYTNVSLKGRKQRGTISTDEWNHIVAVAEELRAAFQAGEMAESEYCRKLKAL